jgi:hypothetical protein
MIEVILRIFTHALRLVPLLTLACASVTFGAAIEFPHKIHAPAELVRVIPRETRRQNAWDQKIGLAWSAVFGSLDIPPDGQVIEIAPGDRAKVGYGLVGTGFKGRLYVVEPNGPSLESVVEKYRQILPHAEVIGIAEPMERALPLLPKHPDAIVANHPLDDMVLDKSLSESEREAIFDDGANPTVGDATARAWIALKRDPRRLQSAIASTRNAWLEIVKTLRPRAIAISQYESAYYRKTGFAIPDGSATEVLAGLQKRFGRPQGALWSQLDRHRFQPDRWVVGRLAPREAGEPDAVARLGHALFEQMNARRIPVKAGNLLVPAPVGAATDQAKEFFDLQASPETPKSHEVFVDRQKDPLKIAMNGNLGSGRAAYASGNRNLKGIGATILAVSDDPDHSNGGLTLPNALWERLGANMVHTNFRTGASPVMAVYDRGDRFKVTWGEKLQTAAVLERLDVGGSLDRPTHLFAAGEPVSQARILRMAEQFGRQDAEKYLERIVHGAWSAGNISLEGHMIDFDTVGAVRGRGPVYTLTGRWLGNQFGNEHLGQLEVLKSVVNDPINRDQVSYAEVEKAFGNARSTMLLDRFPDFMGIPSRDAGAFVSAHREELNALVARFLRISALIYPRFKALAAWDRDSAEVSVFDVSRFMRLYPLWKRYGRASPERMLEHMGNPVRLDAEENDGLAPVVQDWIRAEGLVVDSPALLEKARAEARAFIEDYDRLLAPSLGDASVLAHAYRVNEDRLYLDYRVGNRLVTKLAAAYDRKEISALRLARLTELMQTAIDRVPFAQGRCSLVDVQIHREGWTARRLGRNGRHTIVVGLFKDGAVANDPPLELAWAEAGLRMRPVHSDYPQTEMVFESAELPPSKLGDFSWPASFRSKTGVITWTDF